MPRFLISIAVVCIAGLVAAGCGPARFGPQGADDSNATPTFEAIPTFTPTTESVAADSAEPATMAAAAATEIAPTPGSAPAEEEAAAPASEGPAADAAVDEGFVLPTATPSAAEVAPPTADVSPSPATASDSPLLRVASASVNVRRGPGTDYDAIGVAAQGETFPLQGRNEQADWWQVCCFEDEPGWLYGPLVEVENADGVALAADIPPPPERAPEPVPVAEQEPAAEPVAEEPEPAPAPASPDATANAGTAGSFDPEAQYHIVHYRVLGFDDNNGGIFNKGGQQLIFVTVLDENGNGVDGAVVKDAVGDKLNVSVGSKGPGKAEIKMDWDPYKLYVAADPSGPVTSQISNQMNNPYPHIPDVVGMLGPVDNEYAICPTVDDRCEPPFYHAHWSYEITFQKVR